MSDGDESGAVPARVVDARVHGAVWNRSEVSASVVSFALAAGLSLPGVRRTVVVAVPARGSDVRPVPGLPASDPTIERNAVRCDQVAADDLVPGHPFADIHQDPHGGAGTETALGGDLSHRLASQAQGYGSDETA